ncbi:hypothetical protein, partial [Succinimonas sp.]|uniref:hypothetical protein n=1 Tax=Succinimonas sp. TaxID=1936151 RepID=UPI003867A90A
GCFAAASLRSFLKTQASGIREYRGAAEKAVLWRFPVLSAGSSFSSHFSAICPAVPGFLYNRSFFVLNPL